MKKDDRILKEKNTDQHSFQLWNKKYITMMKWNEKEIVDSIVSKYNKITCYREKYKNMKINILLVKDVKRVLQFQLPNT